MNRLEETKRNSFKVQIVNQDHCKIEATCEEKGLGQSHFQEKEGGTTNIYNTFNIVNTLGNSESLNFSKTASNVSFQTVRISKNSVGGELILGNSINFNISKKSPDEDELIDISSSSLGGSHNSSVIYIKKTSDKSSSILYTPSTICNYYQRSNEVTPNKPSFKLNLRNISNNSENGQSSEENEIIGSSSRQQIMEKKTPIKYTKSQLKSGEKSAQDVGVPSPFTNIFKIDSKFVDGSLSAIAKEAKNTLNLGDDKNEGKNHFVNKFDYSDNPLAGLKLDRKNLTFTFNQIKNNEEMSGDNQNKEIFKNNGYLNMANNLFGKGPELLKLQEPKEDMGKQNFSICNVNNVNNFNNINIQAPLKNENFSFDISGQNFFIQKEKENLIIKNEKTNLNNFSKNLIQFEKNENFEHHITTKPFELNNFYNDKVLPHSNNKPNSEKQELITKISENLTKFNLHPDINMNYLLQTKEGNEENVYINTANSPMATNDDLNRKNTNISFIERDNSAKSFQTIKQIHIPKEILNENSKTNVEQKESSIDPKQKTPRQVSYTSIINKTKTHKLINLSNRDHSLGNKINYPSSVEKSNPNLSITTRNTSAGNKTSNKKITNIKVMNCSGATPKTNSKCKLSPDYNSRESKGTTLPSSGMKTNNYLDNLSSLSPLSAFDLKAYDIGNNPKDNNFKLDSLCKNINLNKILIGSQMKDVKSRRSPVGDKIKKASIPTNKKNEKQKNDTNLNFDKNSNLGSLFQNFNNKPKESREIKELKEDTKSKNVSNSPRANSIGFISHFKNYNHYNHSASKNSRNNSKNSKTSNKESKERESSITNNIRTTLLKRQSEKEKQTNLKIRIPKVNYLEKSPETNRTNNNTVIYNDSHSNSNISCLSNQLNIQLNKGGNIFRLTKDASALNQTNETCKDLNYLSENPSFISKVTYVNNLTNTHHNTREQTFYQNNSLKDIERASSQNKKSNVISNFSNYTKKKSNIYTSSLISNMKKTSSHKVSEFNNMVRKNLLSYMPSGERQLSNEKGVKPRETSLTRKGIKDRNKPIVSSKIHFLNGDDDFVTMEDE